MVRGLALFGSWVVIGCSTTSTIYRVNGPPLEAEVTGGSERSIFVDAEGHEEEIPRDDISRIDYPGNVHAAIGVGVLLYGALNVAVGLPKCERATSNQGAYCTGVFLPAAIGAGMVIWGLVVNAGQHAAVADTSRAASPRRDGDARFRAWSSGQRRAPAPANAGAPPPDPARAQAPPAVPTRPPAAPASVAPASAASASPAASASAVAPAGSPSK